MAIQSIVVMLRPFFLDGREVRREQFVDRVVTDDDGFIIDAEFREPEYEEALRYATHFLPFAI